MRGLILLFLTVASCRADYFAPAQSHGQRASPTYAPPAPVGQDGNVIDTPEVAEAKARHFAEFARAAARASVRASDETEAAQQQHHHGHKTGHFAHQNAVPSLSSFPNYPQHASAPIFRRDDNFQSPASVYRADHLSASASVYGPLGPQAHLQQQLQAQLQPQQLQQQQHQLQPHLQRQSQYDARAGFAAPSKGFEAAAKPLAFLPAPLADDGTVIDTPEVAALKAARLAELAEAEHRVFELAAMERKSGRAPDSQGYRASHGSASLQYDTGLDHAQYNGGSEGRAFPPVSAAYSGQQTFGSPHFGKPYQSVQMYHPHNYQAQQLLGAS